ncbi:MAG TPA: lipoate--protein ligase family protein [Candidatus Paceibacterota bacterium]|nr:lipoate--protein ligase family protein [Candidatus Paceibacterota bacterium]
MKCLNLSFRAPADNLACDEALLDACEAGGMEETLRFWESPVHFVVVGYGNSVATEVNQPACDARNIPILRRASGGGTVVQGPGCLNYSLILKITEDGPLRNITSANRFIMERNRVAMEMLLQKPISVRGHTDLAIGGVKFSGNAQRRKRHALLFHGALLLDFDLALISDLLPMPSKEPDYRQNRTHKDFLTNLHVLRESVQNAFQTAWNATERLEKIPRKTIRSLARDKYATTSWNFKF